MNTDNQLLYSDCLDIMNKMCPNSVDLVYLDPPFNSSRSYNLLYKNATGMPIPEQIEAFCDAWDMDEEKDRFIRKMPLIVSEYGIDTNTAIFWQTWMKALRDVQPKLLAYLVYMMQRLLQIRAVLSPTGSVYLHCDPTASHYIKVIMDGIFGHHNFRNEIIWCYDRWDALSRDFQRMHDVVLRYSKSKEFYFNKLTEIDSRREKTLERGYTTNLLKNGTRQLIVYKGNENRPNIKKLMEKEKFDKIIIKDVEGRPLKDYWIINIIHPKAKERLGYPTQKPLPLLERIIRSSSKEGDTVFDPFCGCGTSLYASHLLKRRWIGCDIALHAHNLIKGVLQKRYGLNEGTDYVVSGVPKTPEQADELFANSPLHFQNWVVESLCHGFRDTKYSGDRGIDGRLYFEVGDDLKNMVVSVKGGKNVGPVAVRELQGTVNTTTNSEIGALVVRFPPTKQMLSDALSSGVWEHKGKEYQRTQIRTVQELMGGKHFDTPHFVEILHKNKQGEMAVI